MAEFQFVQGTDEPVVPQVRLTRSKDGKSGRAFFRFENPQVVQDGNLEIMGMYMVDEDGQLLTRDVNAKFINGLITALEASYTMRTPQEWDRFILFMDRYAETHGLGLKQQPE